MKPFLLCLSCAVALVPACTCGTKSSDDPGAATTASPSSAASGSIPPSKATRPAPIDAIARFADCTLGHRGVLLDLGDASMRGRYVQKLDRPEPESSEHDGATWARVTSRALGMSFYWSSELDRALPVPPPVSADGGSVVGDLGAYVEGRVRSVSARSVSVYLNGKVVGAWQLAKGETRIVVARGGAAVLQPGANELTLRFNGGSKKEDETLAEIDWVHVTTGEPGEPYAAPTRGDALVNTTAGGVSKHALSIRAPGFVRCTGWLTAGATVESSLALAGPGDADVEVRLLRDRSPPTILGRAHVTGIAPMLSGTSSKPPVAPGWSSLSLPVGDVGAGGTLAAIEIAAVRATKGARVLLGDPRVVSGPAPAALAPLSASRGVVMIVLGAMATRSLSIYGGARTLPEIAAFAATGTVFEAHRASTGLGNGALASMLTGVPPREHTLEDPDARLPKTLTTVVDAARQGGVTTAMFTANPTTSGIFGFERGWDTFTAHSPLEDTPAVQVFDDAARWLEAHARREERFFVVVHARGGHPPWDVTPEDLKAMAPANYSGSMDPKRAGEVLARAHRFPQRYTDADRARSWALYARAVEVHDAALGRLLSAIHAIGGDADTTVIVTGDAGVNESQSPLPDPETLDEGVLSVPLIVRSPAPSLAGRRVAVPTGSVDLARTIMSALSLRPPASFRGVDLFQLASGFLGLSATLAGADQPSIWDTEFQPMRAMIATNAARFSARWGPFVLLGSRERETKLCDLSLEPSCTTDVRKTYPIAEQALHRWALEVVGPPSTKKRPIPREPAFVDPTTMAALVSWGREPERKSKEDRD